MIEVICIFISVKKTKKTPYHKLSAAECLKLLEDRDRQIAELENRRLEQQKELSELSARKAFLDEINEQNERLLQGKNLL